VLSSVAVLSPPPYIPAIVFMTERKGFCHNQICMSHRLNLLPFLYEHLVGTIILIPVHVFVVFHFTQAWIILYSSESSFELFLKLVILTNPKTVQMKENIEVKMLDGVICST
jgi:hypothetical protein